MAYKISDSDFFKRRLDEADEIKGEDLSALASEKTQVKSEPLRIGAAVDATLIDCEKQLKTAGFLSMASEMEKLRQSACHDRFTIAVVGEFSRGKSTFLNKLLQKDVLPVGNLPTTAIMTRIRYNPSEVIIAFDDKNEKVLERELSQESWDGLVAQNFGGVDFQGTALTGINSEWLRETNVELIDTPGAGDLSETRVKVVGDALLGCDGAIITISASSALSLTEKLFIEERLLARKVPFLLLIITKLDTVPVKERTGVIQYIKSKLKSWEMNIPVYVPYQVELSETTFDEIVGMDKVKDEISRWITCPERVKLTETWILEKTADIIKTAISSLREKKLLLEESNEKKREELIAEKRQQLAQARLSWGELRLQMQQKCTECYEFLLSKVDDYSMSITEHLQYEAVHANSPQKWWTEDFPYRIKVELTNMAVGIEHVMARRIGEDAHWYCAVIEETFHSHVLFQKETISDKELFGDFDIGGKIKFDNLDKQRTAFKIGSAVLSISGFALFSALGFLPIIATMGIGTGTAIVSEQFFRKKIEAQREEMKKEIARCVPVFIQESMGESESRLEAVYHNIIDEADQSEQTWLDAQQAAIDSIKITEKGKQNTAIDEHLKILNQQINHIGMLL